MDVETGDKEEQLYVIKIPEEIFFLFFTCWIAMLPKIFKNNLLEIFLL